MSSQSVTNHSYSLGSIAVSLLVAMSACGSTARGADAASKSQTAPAAPSVQSQPSAKPDLARITIEATRDRKAVRPRVNKFVNAVLVRHWNETMLRWDVPLCPLVAGLPRQYGELVLARISQAALEAHAPLAARACKPNLYVVITNDPDQLLKKWWDRDKMMYDTREGIAPVYAFLNSRRPIRVWYNNNIGCGGGGTMSSGPATALGGVGFGLPGMAPHFCTGGGSFDTLLMYGATLSITSAVVVIDDRQVKSLTFQQMADYVALVSLADVRLDPARAPPASILSVFGHSKPPPGLTSWDRALLYALYNTNHASKLQVQEMEWMMADRIASPPPPSRVPNGH